MGMGATTIVRMPPRVRQLPERLRDVPFSVEQGRLAGLSPKQLQHVRLAAPFAGVRAGDRPGSVIELIRAYRPKMADAEFFSHTTAALIHGLWLPPWAAERLELHVAVLPQRRAPRDRAVRGHHLIDRPGLVQVRAGVRVVGPVETWCQLATILHLDDLIVAGDSLVRIASRFTVAELRSALTGRRRPKLEQLAAAVSFVRPRTRSPWETKLRLLIQSAGLPEPEINAVIRTTSGEFVAECDLVYRTARVVMEYEGDYHRTDKQKWRDDIHRYERLQDLGFRIVRVTADDVRLRSTETIVRVRSALVGR